MLNASQRARDAFDSFIDPIVYFDALQSSTPDEVRASILKALEPATPA